MVEFFFWLVLYTILVIAGAVWTTLEYLNWKYTLKLKSAPLQPLTTEDWEKCERRWKHGFTKYRLPVATGGNDDAFGDG